MSRLPCKFCDRGHPDDAGGFYDRAACARRYWKGLAVEARLRVRCFEWLAREYEYRADKAGYVGD